MKPALFPVAPAARGGRPAPMTIPLLIVAMALCAGAPPVARGQEDRLAEAERAAHTGEYAQAEDLFRRAQRDEDSYPAATIGLARVLSETGRYADAEEAVRNMMGRHAGDAALQNTLGEVLLLRGNRAAATGAFRASVEAGAPDHLTAELHLAELLFQKGQREEALQRFDTFIDVYNESESLDSRELQAVGEALVYLGRSYPVLFRDALRAFDEASEADPDALEPRLEAGFLFLEKYNAADASATFDEILAINPRSPRALLGKARQMYFEGSTAAFSQVREALEVNPNYLEARVFLSGLLLAVEAFDTAAEEAERALALDGESIPALGVLAAAHYLTRDMSGFGDIEQRVLALNPRDGAFYLQLADACVRNRLYREGVGFARRAVEQDPQLWTAWGVLGTNQLRLGQIEEGRRNLETSFAGDPYNVWNKNTLDLLDTFPDYRVEQVDRFELFLRNDEASLLSPMVVEVAESALESMTARYGYDPPGTIRIELYPNEADFSVRTLGLAGLGALGVCFGEVVALDSPSARQAGSFNWGSTLWHELAHTITLGTTDHLIPRWFSEGLSVYEERLARPAWGEETSLAFLEAFLQERVNGIERINDGFMRPSWPGQVQVSYYQASLICDWISEVRGFDAILAMLRGYREGQDTRTVLDQVLGMDPKEFDDAFGVYVRKRFASELEVLSVEGTDTPDLTSPIEDVMQYADLHPRDYRAQMTAGSRLYSQDHADAAVSYLERARSLLPWYAGGDSPYPLLARIYLEQGEDEKAAGMLERLVSVGEENYEAHLRYAAWLGEKGEVQRAAEVLDRTIYIYPFEAEVHVERADLLEKLGRWDEAVKARRAVVTLDPVDRAEALYRLAAALAEAGERVEARLTVLQSLEIAPTFEPALDLLLQLQPPPSPLAPEHYTSNPPGRNTPPEGKGR